MDTVLQPVMPDWSGYTFGDRFTSKDLLYLRMRDAHAKFLIDTLTNDAFSNGFEYAGTDNADPDKIISRACRRATKWARQFGWGLVHVSNGEIEAYPPVGDSAGGITEFKTGDDGRPTEFTVTIGKNKIVLPASECTIFTNGDETRSWQGYSCLGNSIDEFILKRSWRGAALERARAYARVVHMLIVDGQLSPTDRAEIKKSFPNGDVAVLASKDANVTYIKVGGNLEIGELDRVMEDSIEAMAVGGGITKNDMKGAEAGQKLSTDSNQHHYFAEVHTIQSEYFRSCREVFSKFSISIKRFNDAWEIPKVQKVQLKLQVLQMLLVAQAGTSPNPVVTRELESLLLNL